MDTTDPTGKTENTASNFAVARPEIGFRNCPQWVIVQIKMLMPRAYASGENRAKKA